jgi:hypothetical protein
MMSLKSSPNSGNNILRSSALTGGAPLLLPKVFMPQTIGKALLTGFIWLFGLNYYLEVRKLPDPSETMTITAVFWAFTFFAGIEFYRLFRSRGPKNPKKTQPIQIFKETAKDRRLHVACLTLVYLGIIPLLGFFSSSFLAFAAFSYVLGSRGLLRILSADLLVMACIYIVFTVILKLTLPSGLFV